MRLIHVACFLLSQFLYLALPCRGATYVVTPDTLPVIAEHGAGNEYVLADGTYGSILLLTSFRATKDQPTIIRAENPGKVFIRPKSSKDLCGVWCEDTKPASWLVIDGLEVTGASVDGVRFINSDNVTVRRCKIHNNQNNGIALHKNTDSRVEDCEVYNNGVCSSTQKHGIYASGERVRVHRCRIYHNSGFGLTIWGYGHDCQISDNVCFGNGGGAGIGLQTVERDTDPLLPENGNLVARNCCFANKVGIALSRAAYDLVIDNQCRDNTEASLSFYYASLGPVLLSGNVLDVPAIGLNGKQVASTEPAEDN